MTTSHRPTWNSVIASGTNPSGNMMMAQTTKVNNRDAASFTKLKTRQVGQGVAAERGSRKDFQEDLERREKKAREEASGGPKGRQAEAAAKKASEEENPFPEDADEEIISHASNSDAEGKNDDDDDEDEDTEELMRELAKIRREREAEAEAQKAQQRESDERMRRDEIMKGNPLLHTGDFSLKRKWDDDTVFKNQARTAPKPKLRYINDAVRSDFHKKFLSKYVWVDGHAH